MTVEARRPIVDGLPEVACTGCSGAKKAPIATVLAIYDRGLGVTIALCQECGRDVANAVGFMCIHEGGWSKLEPRKRKPKEDR
jgi:hypothetical protein